MPSAAAFLHTASHLPAGNMCLVFWSREQSGSPTSHRGPCATPRTRSRGCPRCWLARPLVAKGNLGAEIWVPFPLLRSREKGKHRNQQNGQGVWTDGGRNGFFCFSSVAGMEKIRAKQKKTAALQQAAGVLPTWP